MYAMLDSYGSFAVVLLLLLGLNLRASHDDHEDHQQADMLPTNIMRSCVLLYPAYPALQDLSLYPKAELDELGATSAPGWGVGCLVTGSQLPLPPGLLPVVVAAMPCPPWSSWTAVCDARERPTHACDHR